MPKKAVISIVDDDRSVREGTKDLLDAAGFAVESFDSPAAFLQSGCAERTSCLITDMRMPEMSGFELYSHLVASGKAVPTILITAFPNATDCARALQAGVHCYLPKPFAESELLECLRSALASRNEGKLS